MDLKSNIAIFLRLNIFGASYALILFIHIQLLMNIYGISRITNCSVNTVSTWVGILIFITFIVSSILFYLTTGKYLSKVKSRFIITLLWIPYFILFTLFLSPSVPRGEEPPPVLGLFLIGVFLFYPCYIAFINVVSTMQSNKL